MADEQLVALALVLGDLHRLAEPRLAVRVVAVGGFAGALELVGARERSGAGAGRSASAIAPKMTLRAKSSLTGTIAAAFSSSTRRVSSERW